MWGWNGHMGWGFMGLWWLIILLVIFAATAWSASWASRRTGGPPGGAAPGEDTPEQVVKRRYARGEIDRDTYQRMIEDLRR